MIQEFVLENSEVQKTFETYSSWEWRYGKSPECETSYSYRFDWGEVEVWLKLHKMYISEITVYSDALDVELPRKLEQMLLNKRYDMADLELEKETAECTPEQKEKLRQVTEWLSGLWSEE